MQRIDHDIELQRIRGRVPRGEDAPMWLGPLVLVGILVVIAVGTAILG